MELRIALAWLEQHALALEVAKLDPLEPSCVTISIDFHFYSLHQVRVDTWPRGRIVLVGDAGYSVVSTGQGTTVAMVGAQVAWYLLMHLMEW